MFNHNRPLHLIATTLLAALLFAAGCATTGPQGATGALPGKGGPVIREVKATEKEGLVVITFEADKPLNYSAFKTENPSRLVVDLPAADISAVAKPVPVNRGPVAFVKPVPAAESEKGVTPPKLEIHLNQPASYDIKAEGSMLLIYFAVAEKAEPKSETAKVEEPAVTSVPVKVEVAPSVVAAETEQGKSLPAKAAPPPVDAAKPAATSAAKKAVRLIAVEILASPSGTQVIIEGDGVLEYEYFLVEAKSLVVDVFSVDNSVSPLSRKVNDPFIKQIRLGEHQEPKKKVRVVLDLAKTAEYKVVSADNRVLVNFGGIAKESDDKLRSETANLVTDVYFRPLEDRSVIEIVSAQRPDYQKVDSDDPNRLIIDINNARLAPEAQKTLNLESLNREITKISSFQFKKGDVSAARIVAQFKDKTPYRIETGDNRVLVEVPRVKAAAPAPAATPQAPSAKALEVKITPAAPPEMPLPEPAPAEEQPPPPPAEKLYTGRKLSLDFKDAEITDVLRLVADVSGINFVSGPEVKGKVSIKLTDVPWDQALDIILKTNTPPLTQIREAENIIRITTLENVRREEDERQRTEKAKVDVIKTQQALEPLVTKSFHISYAKVAEIKLKVESFMSDRKKTDAFVKEDERTSTLLVRDLQANIDEIENIIKQLDTPTPAVQIEARIVQVDNDYKRSLGIQWGFTAVADQAHGNATPFTFPNSIGIGGTAGTGAGGAGYLVNLPAASATSGIGLTLGHIANTLTLDLRLSAMESMGQVEILSNPKIFVVQNEKAVINVGRQLPVPKTDAEGNRTVEFKDVGIKLEVLPQVTADKRIFLDVKVERSDKGPDVKTSEGEQFSLVTQRAETKVLLSDGETSVIGGLFQQSKSKNTEEVPGLGRIPIIGWLFRTKSTTDIKTELLIFLTPKIVQPQ